MTLQVAIVDDEPLARLRLIKLLDQLPDFSVAGEAESAEEAVSLLAAEPIDICLLDIHMPGLSGMDFAQRLAQQPTSPQVIFCTAYEEHALEAFGVNAVDYVLKPARLARLQQALEKAALLCKAENSPSAVDDHLVVPCGSDTVKVPWKEVLAFVAEDKYVMVLTPNERYLTSVTLKQLEEKFGQRLVRAHRNALAVIDKVVRLHRKHSSYVLELKSLPEPLQVSRRHVQNVRSRLQGLM